MRMLFRTQRLVEVKNYVYRYVRACENWVHVRSQKSFLLALSPAGEGVRSWLALPEKHEMG